MEYMSALQGTFDDAKPSLFELLSEQQLNSLLPPSLRYLLAISTHRHPRYLLPILNSFDELYALVSVALEHHFLTKYGGGFTENFYALKREKALLNTEVPRAQIGAPVLVREALLLTRADVWRNLAVMVGIPYLKRKLDEAYDINAPRALLGANYTRMPANPTLKQRFLHYYRWFLTNVYPSVNAAYYFALLAFQLAYLFDGSKFHNPFLWMIGTRMRRMGGADYAAITALGDKAAAAAAAAAAGNPPGWTGLLSPRQWRSRFLGSLSILLPTSIFALKFLEWWHASDFARQLGRKAAEGLELPPPVVAGLSKVHGTKTGDVSEKGPSGQDEVATTTTEPENPPIAATSLLPIFTVSAPEDSEVCPICKDEMQTATACQTGFVYCYTCIHRWVKGEHDLQEQFMKERAGKWESGAGRCAVTGRRVLGGTEGLRRVMV
jgi:peroxin-12